MPSARIVGVGAVAALAVLVVAGLVARSQRLASGPVDVTWDKEPCAHCHMLLSEPGFAAQLQTADGAVLNFDDVGCLFAWERELQPRVHATWFHHLGEERWLGPGEVAFLPGQHSPMAFGLGAVDAGTPGALTLEQARERVFVAEDGRAGASP